MKRIATSVLALAALVSPARAAVIISTAPTSHMHCTQSACTPKSKNAVLNVSQLQTLLAASNVTVNTGSDAQSIAISSPLTWASTSRLTLSASQGVSIKAAVVVEGTAGLTIAAGGGALNFYPGGSISFWDNASSLIIGGNSYTLVSDVPTLASDVFSNHFGFYALAKDYDSSIDGTYGNSPVTSLDGTFEGLGHTISNVSINVTGYDGYVGFFYEVNGTVRDVILTSASVNCGTHTLYSGVLAGINSGYILNASATGTLTCTAGDAIGGLVGEDAQNATIAHSSASVTLNGGPSLGGLVGVNAGTISDSTASPTISAIADATVGGLVGINGGMIQDSHAAGQILDTLYANEVGGLVGYLDGTVERCFSTLPYINGKFGVGGLVGEAEDATIDSSFATGQVSARRYSGGLLGLGNGNVTISNSYATGAVVKLGAGIEDMGGLVGNFQNGITISSSWSSTGIQNRKREVRGGFVGSITNATVTAGYWDLTTSGVQYRSQGAGNVANFPGITGLKTVQFQAGLPAGFDPAIWGQNPSINNGFPYLLANPPQ